MARSARLESGCLFFMLCRAGQFHALVWQSVTPAPASSRVRGVFLLRARWQSCAFRPRFVGDAHRRRVSGRVSNSPEPARTIGRVFDYSAEGTPLGGARRPASPADPVPPVEHHGLLRPGAQTALLDGQPAGANAPPAEQRGSRQLCQTHRPPRRMCEAKWRRGVGRQARQSGGEL
jgi:hypothetical protein